MNFSECLSNNNKHLLTVKAFYAHCLDATNTPVRSAERCYRQHFTVGKGEARSNSSKFGGII